MSHPFSHFIRELGRGKKGSRSLTQAEAYEAMTMILNQQVEDIQLGAFLMLLRVKEETPEELAGFVQAVRDYIQAQYDVLPQVVDIDWANYAGKRKQLPWNLLTAKQLRDEGKTVLIHGCGEHTPERLYTEKVFKEMNWPIAQNPSHAAKLCASEGWCYLPLAAIHPHLETLINLKPLLGLRSPINTICRLLNPLQAKHGLHGIFHPNYLPAHQQTAMLLGDQSMLAFKGEGGDTEIRPEAKTKLIGVKAGQPFETVLPSALSERPEAEPVVDVPAFRQMVEAPELISDYGKAAMAQTYQAVQLLMAQS